MLYTRFFGVIWNSPETGHYLFYHTKIQAQAQAHADLYLSTPYVPTWRLLVFGYTSCKLYDVKKVLTAFADVSDEDASWIFSVLQGTFLKLFLCEPVLWFRLGRVHGPFRLGPRFMSDIGSRTTSCNDGWYKNIMNHNVQRKKKYQCTKCPFIVICIKTSQPMYAWT